MFNWLSIIAGIFYIILGIAVIVYKFFIILLEANVAYPLGALMVVYGIFRIARAIYKMRNTSDEN